MRTVQQPRTATTPAQESETPANERAAAQLSSYWLLSLLIFLGVLLIWWVLFQYFGNSSQNYGLGFWIASDRPSWLPQHSGLLPLIGDHYFGDWFQLYYLIHSGAPYTGHIFHTELNPGYLLPAFITSWLPYRAAGFSYLAMLIAAWLSPSYFIYKHNRPLAVLYLLAVTLNVPGLMALDLGQPQIFVFILGLFGYYQLTRRNPVLASLFLGLAIAIKPYMLLFLLVLLAIGFVRDAIRAVAIAALVNLIMGAVLVGTTIFSPTFWIRIISASFSYGSGSNLAIWGFGGFLRTDSSLYGLLDTIGHSRVPLLSDSARSIAMHYTLASLFLLLLGLIWWWTHRRALSISNQWLYLTLLLLLIPSYSLGYAWLLLLIPSVPLAFGDGRALPPWSIHIRAGRLTPSATWLALLIFTSILPYPANIRLPGFSTQFGPNGNTVMTPILLASAAVLLMLTTGRAGVHRRRRLMRSPRPRAMVPKDDGLALLQFEPAIFGWPMAAAIAFEAVGLLLCYALSR